MTDFLLAKPKLPEGWIDCSVGEAHVVREILLKHFSIVPYELPNIEHMFEYPNPCGYGPLVSLLEEKYGYPVVITNGAKGALGATFYALKKLGKQNVGMIEPYWALIPPLMEIHGITPAIGKHPYNVDAFLALHPNNPDGQFPYLSCLEDTCRSKNIPLIHDAVYYSPVYTSHSEELKVYGDVQIYSASKAFGLSGIRVGWAVCKSPIFYKYIQEYMEAMTVGVSITSQIFLYDLLLRMKVEPEKLELFEIEASAALTLAKQTLLGVDPDILMVDKRIVDRPGMFGWFAVGPKANFQKSKINFIDGALFGGPGMVRMNLAFNQERMNEIVRRLNSVKE